MPTLPNATVDLSGGAGITKALLVARLLRRLDDNPWVDVHTNAINTTDASLTVASDATKKYQIGGYIDWVADGTFETAKITAVTATTLTIERGHRETTAGVHAAGAKFRYLGRFQPLMLSEVVDDILDSMWPELFDVRHVDWTISTSATPELWYGLPADAERVLELYQHTNSTPVDNRVPSAWMGPHWQETAFLGGSVPKALQVYGTAMNSNDNKLHGIYIARLLLTNLTSEQTAILVYMAGAVALQTVIAGETKPERRSSVQGAPTPDVAAQFWMREAAELKRKEQERLMEYLPRRNRVKYRGGRHYTDATFAYHPVRSY